MKNPKINVMIEEHISRVQNNGRSTDNVRPKSCLSGQIWRWPGMRSGHFFSLLALYIACHSWNLFSAVLISYGKENMFFQIIVHQRIIFNFWGEGFILFISLLHKMKASAYKHIKPFCCNVYTLKRQTKHVFRCLR